ncbi:hypothetical protein CSOJ01_15125 [Colletotrichum sojae]|uniref:Uncharacterized protein n=1 Tax=Colletotrichum sojae TaxID=2175907 RepID=A0A8H6MJA7_9PEZI|nr:hypothetical protein CSOJ01_15125 [Colletotrichum sojae]
MPLRDKFEDDTLSVSISNKTDFPSDGHSSRIPATTISGKEVAQDPHSPNGDDARAMRSANGGPMRLTENATRYYTTSPVITTANRSRRDSYDRDDKKSSSGGGGLLGGMLGGGGGKDKKDKKDNDGGFTDKVIDGVAEYAKKKW